MSRARLSERLFDLALLLLMGLGLAAILLPALMLLGLLDWLS